MPRANRNARRVTLLADRLAILLVVCKNRSDHEDWRAFMSEGLYDEEGSLGDEIRGWPEFKEAKNIVRLWLRKLDKRLAEEEKKNDNEG